MCHPCRPRKPLRHPCQKLSDVFVCYHREKVMSETEAATEPAHLLPRICKSFWRDMSPSAFAPPKLCICLSTPGFGNQQGFIWHERHLSSAWQGCGRHDETQHLYTWPPTNQAECCRTRLRASWLPLYHLHNLLISFLRTTSQLSFCRQVLLYKIISPTPYKIIT